VSNQGMIRIDVGGTFTDDVSIEDGKINALKVRTNYTNMDASVLEGAEGLAVESKSVFNHTSTAGLNAIITRKLPKVAYLTTYVHRDVLDMARLWRPFEALTDANWRRSFGDASRPLVPGISAGGSRSESRTTAPCSCRWTKSRHAKSSNLARRASSC
jgi:N-methylhydantoinase A